MRNQFFSGLLAVVFLVGCSDDDNPPILPDSPELGKTLTAAMGKDLSKQVFINLSEGTTTSVDVNTWELAFENDGNAIRSNTAKKVAVAIPEASNFDDVTSDEGLVYAYDSEDGDLSTTAFKGWKINTPYIIDLGIDKKGNASGEKKIMITATTSENVSIKFADLDGENAGSETVDYSSGKFTFFSLINKKTVTVEPENWDFMLTGISVRTGPPTNPVYRLAAAAIINHYDGVEVAKDDPFKDLDQNDDPKAEKNLKTIEDGNFETLALKDFSSLGSSSAGNAIGRSWLQVLAPHSAGISKVYDFITYIVKDQDKNYYKLRFLAYKGGDNSENGHPTFEYELITK